MEHEIFVIPQRHVLTKRYQLIKQDNLLKKSSLGIILKCDLIKPQFINILLQC
jgi:hypothetical protein